VDAKSTANRLKPAEQAGTILNVALPIPPRPNNQSMRRSGLTMGHFAVFSANEVLWFFQARRGW